jgi:hypothetical protein
VDSYAGQNVVIDVESMYVFLGKLTEVSEKTLTLKNADVHDLRDSTTTREAYVREARLHGIQPNRDRVLLQRQQVVSISLLADVIP